MRSFSKQAASNVPLLRPFNSRVIHLVDNDNQTLHTGSTDQHGVLSSLTTFFEPSLEFTFSRRNDLCGKVDLSRVKAKIQRYAQGQLHLLERHH